jgi:aspartyl-tRNA(Asn)/glutamyl-tRNA(Gln) amidotransferase subunit A
MRVSDLEELTLASASADITAGRLSPVELTECLIRRIRQTEPKILAYVTLAEDAILRAHELESKIRQKKRIGTLAGIPITVKDLIKTKGIKTTAGSKVLSNNIPKMDATVVRKIKESGGFLLGKSNTHEFALGAVTPPTKNPWNLEMIPGGSSGGSAAAIAALSALASLGSDTGGSIRIPASYCGVVGLKPTYGRVSKFGVYPESWSLDHVGPITKTVEDAAIMMNVISGFDELDPDSVRASVPDFAASLKKSIKGIRIGIPKNHFFEHVHEEVRLQVNESIKQLERLGAILCPFEFPNLNAIMAAYTAIDISEVSSFHEDYYKRQKSDYQRGTKNFIEQGFAITAVQYLKAQRVRALLTRQVLNIFSKIDVIVTPTQPVPAQAQGTSFIKYSDGFVENIGSSWIRFLAMFNLTGLPALSIMCGLTSSKPRLPVGLQIIGNLFDEKTVLRVAHAYEQSTNWRKQKPPI